MYITIKYLLNVYIIVGDIMVIINKVKEFNKNLIDKIKKII